MLSVRQLLKHLVNTVIYGTVGVLITLLVVFVTYLNGRPELEVWHTAELTEEFTAGSPVSSFREYLALEGRLFEQLDELVYAKTAAGGNTQINRYQRGALADPRRWPQNWNRSFLMESDKPGPNVLMLHGLSDAPYSLRNMAQRFHRAGATVLGLRVPGHGTAPSGLVHVSWQDMAAAVRIAVMHLAASGQGRPLYIVGYSNGAALAVHHVLTHLDDPEAPRIAGLVLLSPEIGVTPAAALAVWQARLGHLLGMEKLAWNDILPEYEPFKYGSFAINAGDVSYRITTEIQRQISELEDQGALSDMPPILAFSSVIDATVEAPALVNNLFNRLQSTGHELVLFDINRQSDVEELLRWRPDTMINALRRAPRHLFTLSLVTNQDRHSAEVIEQRWEIGQPEVARRPLGLSWPQDIHSLSHVALPFPPDDPLYGGRPVEPSPGIHLGDIAVRGERDALAISESALVRLRWNPFYAYIEERALAFVGLK